MTRRTIALAFASATLFCGGTPPEPSIRFLRSDSHTFSRTERRLIAKVAINAVRDARRLLATLPPNIELTVRAGEGVIAETGESGTAMPPAWIMWTVDPSRPGGVEGVVHTWLRASLFHELHHLARHSIGAPRTAVDHAIFEGLATAFERDAARVQPPWGVYPDNVRDWATELVALPADTPPARYLCSHPDGRKWFGIRVGTYWVDTAMNQTKRSAADLAATPTDELLQAARRGTH